MSDANSFMSDGDASSVITVRMNQITAPMVKGTPLALEEVAAGGGLRVVMFVLDASSSMQSVEALLRDGFNDYFVPAVSEARQDAVEALRIGGVVFNSGVRQIWRGPGGEYFHRLEDLPNLTDMEYETCGSTMLYDAIVEATAIALRYAEEMEQETGIAPNVDIIIQTDGENTAGTRSPDEARRLITGRDKSRIRYVYLYYETGTQVDAQDVATRLLGIESEQVQSFVGKPGETDQDRARRMRRLMDVISRVSASRATTASAASQYTEDDLA